MAPVAEKQHTTAPTLFTALKRGWLEHCARYQCAAHPSVPSLQCRREAKTPNTGFGRKLWENEKNYNSPCRRNLSSFV